MPYYKTCQLCGASLDPGEHCDCEESAPSVAADEAHDREPRPSIQQGQYITSGSALQTKGVKMESPTEVFVSRIVRMLCSIRSEKTIERICNYVALLYGQEGSHE